MPDPGYSQDTIAWPLGDVMPASLPEGIDYSKLESILEGAIDAPGDEPLKKTPAPASDGHYAGTFWLQEPNPENALNDVPDDIFFADGFLGQRVYIIPSKKLVVVRMGYSLSNISMNDFLREIIATLPA